MTNRNLAIIGLSPIEIPDLGLAKTLHEQNAFPVIHLGRERDAAGGTLSQIAEELHHPVGVCIASENVSYLPLPEQVSMVIAPLAIATKVNPSIKTLYQITSIEEAHEAKKLGAKYLIAKGNESGGKVGYESTFILFQRIMKEVSDVSVWVQGGLGVHTSAAVMGLGASGIILDSQLTLFPECTIPRDVKAVCEKLNGNETVIIDNYRVLQRPNSPSLPENPAFSDLETYLGKADIQEGYLPLGQDIAISIDLVKRYKKIGNLIFAIREAIHGHMRQAKSNHVIREGCSLAQELNITYPIAQGPMTRVSDIPAFAASVANAGALPFIALSLVSGQKAKHLILETKRQVKENTWGAGILGFAPQEIRDEQTRYILEEKPSVVIIAGGRPSQSKPFEKAGIKTFLHVPSTSLLDMFIKEGARRFVFEGRECGGHVGPLSSFILWEKQIERLLQEDNAEQFTVFFAGGIHDSFSSALISVMAAPLAAKGMKIGILMGTAYLYTEEAVASGAILKQYQDEAIKQKHTVLLETAPGHETRCLKSPFVDVFNEEKRKLVTGGVDKKEIWAKLESLNLGKLRIAAKGVERKGDSLVTIDKENQFKTGMYMIGQVAALRKEAISMEELHLNVVDGYDTYIKQAELQDLPERDEKSLDVAIVGMACIYPGAKNIEDYWKNILLGNDLVTEVPDERWNKDLYYDPEATGGEKSPTNCGGFIPKIDFDPAEFGIPPQSLAAIESSQILSLLVAKQALEDAGYHDGQLNTDDVSVIIGAEGGNELANAYGLRCAFRQVFGDMPADIDNALPKLTEDSFPGILANVISGRISNRLNLGGRNFTVDAACASSLAAVDIACQELASGRSDMVLAGGVDMHNSINDYLLFASTHALSRKGKCLTFDAEADGIALGEGVGMVVLKRYDDAKRDGDKIYAVLKGIGGSSDGKSLGLTAPRKSGQMKALERAYEQAGVSISSVGLIEAHGTGTVVGDKTELSALTDTMISAGATKGQTYLGSVKTQIGHTKCAAGLASLIKTALSVYYGVKPPTINLNKPNSYFNPETSPFRFNLQAGLWNDKQRRAGLSAFGFGGTNFHAVLENTEASNLTAPTLNSWPSELFVFRGESVDEAKQLLKKVKDILSHNDSICLRDIAYSLAEKNSHPIHITIVSGDAEDLQNKLNDALAGTASPDVWITNEVEGKVAFLFPGQGSQRVNMARDLFVVFPDMRKLLIDNQNLESLLFPPSVFDDSSTKKQKEAIKDTLIAQPLLGIVDLAIARLLESLGLQADMVAGHSYGELPALCFAGVFEDNQIVDLSSKRAKAILNAAGDDPGSMVAVSCEREKLEHILQDKEDVYLVNFNSPTQLVVAGSTPAISQLQTTLTAEGISFTQLEVACAFHSPLLKSSKSLYEQEIADMPFTSPTIPVWSNTTATTYPTDPAAIKERLGDHLVAPVRFTEEIQNMYDDGARVFIEVGPGKVLSRLSKAILGKEELVIHTEDREAHGLTNLMKALASYVASGRTLQLEKLFEGRNAQSLDLDKPELYLKKSTVWRVNGQMSVPLNGQVPKHGFQPVTQPIGLNGIRTPAVFNDGTSELLVQDYLDNMKSMIQAQRDVMLGYLGKPIDINQAPTVQPEIVTPSQSVKQISTGSSTATLTEKDIIDMLLKLITEKTGYPLEMLGENLDLEADLSIDSIKRMEIIGGLRNLLGAFSPTEGNEEAVVEQLAAIKTVKGLASWIIDNALQQTDSVQAVQDQPSILDEEEIKKILVTTVSEKTGYPIEMLGLELDLEADLSIDSIKRMEIIGGLKDLLGGLNGSREIEETVIEQLARIKTIQGLAKWIVEQAAKQDNTATPINHVKGIPESQPTEVASQKPEKVTRFKFELIPSQLEISHSSGLNGERFAITNDGSNLPSVIKASLESQGAEAEIISENDTLTGYSGFIVLNMVSSPGYFDILTFFSMVKKLNLDKVKWIYAVSGLKRHLQANYDIKLLRQMQGYSGFLKSLDKEVDHLKCKKISLNIALKAEETAKVVLNELLHGDQLSEVSYIDHKRQAVEMVREPLTNEQAPSHISLDEDAVILVLGGAQGITAELMIDFAKEYPCHYILVGRSPAPDKNGTADYTDLKTKDDIRKVLIASGEFKSPAEIEKKTQQLFKSNQIRSTLSTFEQNGAKASYHSLDLRDENGMIEFISMIYSRYNRIDGVVHGAGLLEDKLFHDKTSESFERVFTTKVTPIRVLAEHLRSDVKFIVLFSSVASVFGNRGQTDYAAANDVMDFYAWELKNKFNGKVTAINWGPWKGTGMVSPELEKEFERKGIALIPLEAGKELFLKELKYGQESQVMIMAGESPAFA